MSELAGRWRVERTSGLLPPFGLRKRIGADAGWTALGPVPVARFRVRGRTLAYAVWPLQDELIEQVGLIFGREFCRFRLVRDQQG
jgi:hypothetical protein